MIDVRVKYVPPAIDLHARIVPVALKAKLRLTRTYIGMAVAALAIASVAALVPAPSSAGHINGGEGHGGNDGNENPSVEPAVVVDSQDQVIGQALDINKNCAQAFFRLDDERFTVFTVCTNPDVIAGDSLHFENNNCDVPGFTLAGFSNSPPADPPPIMYARVAIGPPGRTLFVESTDPMFESINIQSTYNPTTLTCDLNSGSRDDAIRVHPVQELNFVPPFGVR